MASDDWSEPPQAMAKQNEQRIVELVISKSFTDEAKFQKDAGVIWEKQRLGNDPEGSQAIESTAEKMRWTSGHRRTNVVAKSRKRKTNEGVEDVTASGYDITIPRMSEVHPAGTKKRRREERQSALGNLSEPVPPKRCCFNGRECGRFYDQLGHGATVNDIRASLEEQTGWQRNQIRFEEICFMGIRGVNGFGCPIAKWILKRPGEEEKLLVLVKRRPNHVCNQSIIVVALVIWEGLPEEDVYSFYCLLRDKLPGRAKPDGRGCAQNEDKYCLCQGVGDPATNGRCFTFGCRWHRFNGACRSSKSDVKKFCLKNDQEDQEVEAVLSTINSYAAKVVELLTPVAFQNMTRHNEEASDCRLSCDSAISGESCVLPFSGTTVCMDFATHPHQDMKNMHGGVTAVISLAAPPDKGCAGKSDNDLEDQQLHVLVDYGLVESDGTIPAADAGVKKLDKFFTRSCILTEAALEAKAGQACSAAAASRGANNHKKRRSKAAAAAHERRVAARADLAPSGVGQLLDKDKTEYEIFESDNLDKIQNPNVGGVALLLPPGSILLEAAKYETHATTALLCPNSHKPHRISVVGYQHHSLNQPHHGRSVV